MKAIYNIRLKPIDIRGEITEWTDTTARIKTNLNLIDEDGKEIQFEGILCEVKP